MHRTIVNLLMVLALSGGFTAAFLDKRSAKQVANDLYKRYRDHKKCKNDKGEIKPAFQCTGIMIRGVRHDESAQAWKLKPKNEKKKSFSVAFLRSGDAKWSYFPFDYKAGFILYPHLQTPENKNRYKVFCAFPYNGSTDKRDGHGCNKSLGAPNSGHCDKQGIHTFEQWLQHFQTETQGLLDKRFFMSRQCSFDMRLSSRKATRMFETVLAASKYLQGQATFKYTHNELLFHAWDPSSKNAKKLPIEAFFYKSGSVQGKQAAKRFQAEYKRLTNEKRPIVSIRLPGPGIPPKFKVRHI